MVSPNDNNIDRIFNEHFEQLELPMSGVDDLWAKIDKKKKRRRLMPFWIFGFFIILFSFTSLYFINASESQKDKTTSIQQKQFIDFIDTNSKKKKDLSNASNLSNSAVGTKNSNELIEVPKTIRQTTNSNSILNVADMPYNIPVQKTTAVVKTNEQFGFSKTPINHSLSIAKASETTFQNFKQSDAVKNSNSIQFLHVVSNNAKQDFLTNLPVKSMLGILKPNVDLQFPMATLSLEPNKSIKPLANQAHKPKIFVDLFSQAFIPFEKIKRLDNTSRIGESLKSELYESLRNQHFDPLASYGGGIQMGALFNNGLGVSVGLEYLRTESQFTDEQIEVNRILSYDSTAYIIKASSGQDLFIGDEIYGQLISKNDVFEAVREDQYNIPISLFYRLKSKSKLQFQLKGSLVYMLNKTVVGKHIADDLILFELNSEMQQTYFNQALNFDIGLDIGYNISQNLEIYLNPKLRYDPSHLNSDLVKISRTYYGGQLGIRYFLKN